MAVEALVRMLMGGMKAVIIEQVVMGKQVG